MKKMTHEQWLCKRVEEEYAKACRQINNVLLQFIKGSINWDQMNELFDEIDDDLTKRLRSICQGQFQTETT